MVQIRFSKVLDANDKIAADNRRIFVIGGSRRSTHVRPGAGKTSVLEQTRRGWRVTRWP